MATSVDKGREWGSYPAGPVGSEKLQEENTTAGNGRNVCIGTRRTGQGYNSLIMHFYDFFDFWKKS